MWENICDMMTVCTEYLSTNYVLFDYAYCNRSFPLQTKIQDITTGELHYLLGEGANFNTNLQGNMIAKEINKVMDNIPNWEKKTKYKAFI